MLQSYRHFVFLTKLLIFLHRIYKMQNQEACNLMYSLPDFDYSLDDLT